MHRQKRQKRQADFKHLKFKVGRRAPVRDNVTRTDFAFRAVHVPTQAGLAEKSEELVTSRKLTLQNLLAQIRHHNHRVRSDALVGFRELVTKHPQLMQLEWARIVQAVLSMIVDAEAPVRRAVIALLELMLPSASEVVFAPFARTFVVYISSALSHTDAAVQRDALFVLRLCLQKHGDALRPFVHSLYPNLVSVFSRRISHLARSPTTVAAHGGGGDDDDDDDDDERKQRQRQQNMRSRRKGSSKNGKLSSNAPLIVALECMDDLLKMTDVVMPLVESIEPSDAPSLTLSATSREEATAAAAVNDRYAMALSALVRHPSSKSSALGASQGVELLQQLRVLPIKYAAASSSLQKQGLKQQQQQPADQYRKPQSNVTKTFGSRKKTGNHKRKRRMNTFVAKPSASSSSSSTSSSSSASSSSSSSTTTSSSNDSSEMLASDALASFHSALGDSLPLLLDCWVEYAPQASSSLSSSSQPQHWVSIDRLSPAVVRCLVLVSELLRRTMQVMGHRATASLDQPRMSLGTRTLWHVFRDHVFADFPFRVPTQQSPAWTLNLELCRTIQLVFAMPATAASKFMQHAQDDVIGRVKTFLSHGLAQHPSQHLGNLLAAVGSVLPLLQYEAQEELLTNLTALLNTPFDRTQRAVQRQTLEFVHALLEPPNGHALFEQERFGAVWVRRIGQVAAQCACSDATSDDRAFLARALQLVTMTGRFFQRNKHARDALRHVESVLGDSLYAAGVFDSLPVDTQRAAIIALQACGQLRTETVTAVERGVVRCASERVPVDVRTMAVDTVCQCIVDDLCDSQPDETMAKLMTGFQFTLRVALKHDDSEVRPQHRLLVVKSAVLALQRFPIARDVLASLIVPVLQQRLESWQSSGRSAAVACSLLLLVDSVDVGDDEQLRSRIVWESLVAVHLARRSGDVLHGAAFCEAAMTHVTKRIAASSRIAAAVLALAVADLESTAASAAGDGLITKVDSFINLVQLVPRVQEHTDVCRRAWSTIDGNAEVPPMVRARLQAVLTTFIAL